MANNKYGSKEYYVELINKIGKHLEKHSKDYLEDMDVTRIRNIHFQIDIELDSLPIITLKKEYFPDEVI